MTDKMIVVDFSNGDSYSIPATFVANKIAEYYCGKEDVVYNEEFERAYASDYALTDWLSNNMDWADVSHVANRLGMKALDYKEDWSNAKKTVI